MKKRRTRGQKENPHHPFTISWLPEPHVKGQIENQLPAQNPKLKAIKNADNLTKEEEFEATKRDIIKSLILISLILALELVIYLAWNKF